MKTAREWVCDMSKPSLRFADLFSELGGFHIALSRLGHKCVFAAEIDRDLRDLYHLNFRMSPASDIRFCWKDVPEHEVLCAGFPCQPFSKAGSQSGFACPNCGDLFDYVLKIVDRHNPRFLLLENVPNILRHAEGATWQRIQDSLRARGYSVASKEISPHEIGVPQVRARAIIVASNLGLDRFRWPELNGSEDDLHISAILDDPRPGRDELPDIYIRYLEVWQDFLDRVDVKSKMPSFPIWAMEFGADYPYQSRTPTTYGQRYLAGFHGAFGYSLAGKSKTQQIARLPPYARGEIQHFPRWKIRYITQNPRVSCKTQSQPVGLATAGAQVSAELSKVRVELAGRTEDRMGQGHPVSCVGNSSEEPSHLSVIGSIDHESSSCNRLAKAVSDNSRMGASAEPWRLRTYDSV